MYQVNFSSKTTEASNNLVLYVRLPGEEDCYYPLFLKEKSVMALKLELAIKMNIDPNTIEKILNKRKTTFSGEWKKRQKFYQKFHGTEQAGQTLVRFRPQDDSKMTRTNYGF